MDLLAMVIAGHLVGDWIVQTDKQAAEKMKPGAEGWAAMMRHVGSYNVTLALATFWCWHGTAWGYLLFMGVSIASHAIIDRRWPVKWLMRVTGSKSFSEVQWGILATDQALHISILCILVAMLGR